MNHRVWRLTTVSTLAILSLVFLTACVCWPSLPTLIHQNGCARIYPASGTQSVSLPPKTFIAYINNQDVWIMDENGADKKQLTETTGHEFSLSAAFHTERLWFIRSESTAAGSKNYGDVYSCDYEGKNVEQVTSGLKVRFAAVSPDGKKLAISVVREVETLIKGVLRETADMYIISATANQLTALENAVDLSSDLKESGVGGREGSTFLAWAPGADKVAFTFKPDGSSSLGISTRSVYLADADGGNRKKLMGSADEPRFNDYGDKLVVTTGAHWDMIGVATVSLDGDTESILPVSTTQPMYSAYTPFWFSLFDDKEHIQVAYARQTHPAEPAQLVNTLERYQLDNGKTTVMVTMNTPSEVISHADATDISRYIVFQAGVSDPVSGKAAAVWRIKPDGTGLEKLSGEGDDSEPTLAVSYSWYNKGKKDITNPYGCHWPYENFPKGYTGAMREGLIQY